MTCSPCKQRFFMSLPRVTWIFAATQSVLLPQFVLFTFLRRREATGKHFCLTDAMCPPTGFFRRRLATFSRLSPLSQFPVPRAKKTHCIFNLGYGNKLLIDLPAPSSPPVPLAHPEIIRQFHHVRAQQGTPSLPNATALWVEFPSTLRFSSKCHHMKNT